jgi:hypothetical protein
MLSWLVGVLLAAWFLITVLRNLPPLRARLARRDRGGLLPDWALFARPRNDDLVFLRRDLLQDGTLTRWREVEMAGPRRWYNFIWNAELGPRRASIALSGGIVSSASQDRSPPRPVRGQGTRTALAAMISVHYLIALQYLSERSHSAVEATQFMIMSVGNQAITGRYTQAEPGRIQFVSELHQVREPDARGQQARGEPR